VSRFREGRCLTGCEESLYIARSVETPQRHTVLQLQRSVVMSYVSKSVAAPPKVIGFLGFDGVTILDLTGPLEAFATAQRNQENDRHRCYKPLIIGVAGKTFKSRSGVTFKAQHTLETAPPLDSIVIPGGIGLRAGETADTIAAWLAQRAPDTRRIASVGAGIYPFARTGLLDGQAVTTHWRYAGDVARAFPRLRMNSAASFLGDGTRYTCGGGTAPIEMSLAMIEEDCGSLTALAVARELVMSLRPSGNEQNVDVSAPASDVQDRLPSYLDGSRAGFRRNSPSRCWLSAPASVRGTSAGSSRRRSDDTASFVEQLRIGEAERRLATRRTSIESIAASVGFKSAEVFRRAFERRLGQSPSRFQRESQRNAQKSQGDSRDQGAEK
jgi:transcriptional regulator GlxA family with amidase domain